MGFRPKRGSIFYSPSEQYKLWAIAAIRAVNKKLQEEFEFMRDLGRRL